MVEYTIGSNEYIVDFVTKEQYLSDDMSRRRRVTRVLKKNVMKSKQTKGQAGLHFAKKTKKH